jgi:hypothetical protein
VHGCLTYTRTTRDGTSDGACPKSNQVVAYLSAAFHVEVCRALPGIRYSAMLGKKGMTCQSFALTLHRQRVCIITRGKTLPPAVKVNFRQGIFEAAHFLIGTRSYAVSPWSCSVSHLAVTLRWVPVSAVVCTTSM